MVLTRIRDLRDEHDLNQVKTAKLMGVSKSTYARWETDEAIIPLIHLNDLCNKEKLELLKSIDENSSNFFDNFKSELCKECYGESCCCYRYPCIFLPDDFYDINNLEYMKKILDIKNIISDK